MQTSFKFFELIPLGSNSAVDRQKIAFRIHADGKPSQGNDADAESFTACLNSLLSMPADKAKCTLDQLEWIPVNGEEGDLAPVIDLSAEGSEKNVALGKLLESWLSAYLGQQAQVQEQEANSSSEEVLAASEEPVFEVPAELVLDRLFPKGQWTLRPLSDTNGDITRQMVDKGKDILESVLPQSAEPTQELLDKKPADVHKITELSAMNVFQSEKKGPVLPKAFQTEGKSSDSALPETDSIDATDEQKPETEPIAKLQNAQANRIIRHTDQSGSAPKMPEFAAKEPQVENEGDQVAKTPRTSETSIKNNLLKATPGSPQADMAASEKQMTSPSSRVEKQENAELLRTFAEKTAGGGETNQTFQKDSSHSGKQESSSQFSRDLISQVAERIGSEGTASSEVKSVHMNQADASANTKTMQGELIRQIVQRMTYHSNGEQSQMSIQLKPEVLGHLKLQIITENQNVMVKMTAETTAVKEMIEQSLPALKMELQQHGLSIHKFDVFVGQENDLWKQHQQQTSSRQGRFGDNRKARKIAEGLDDVPVPGSATMLSNPSWMRGRQTSSEIDFFA